jgi:hypothetical protein
MISDSITWIVFGYVQLVFEHDGVELRLPYTREYHAVHVGCITQPDEYVWIVGGYLREYVTVHRAVELKAGTE